MHIKVASVICEELTKASTAEYHRASLMPDDPERDSQQMKKQAVKVVTCHSLPG